MMKKACTEIESAKDPDAGLWFPYERAYRVGGFVFGGFREYRPELARADRRREILKGIADWAAPCLAGALAAAGSLFILFH